MNTKSFLYKSIIISLYLLLCFNIYNKETTTPKSKQTPLLNLNIPTIASGTIKNQSTKHIQPNNKDIKYYLQIDKIKLQKPIYNLTNSNNTVEKNIELLKETTTPNNKSSHIFLAAHSGPGINAYFNNLDKLKEQDTIKLTYNNTTYIYSVKNIWEESKNGYIHIKQQKNNSLTLTTCSKNKGKQLVILATQIIK